MRNRILLLAALLMLGGCDDDSRTHKSSKSAEEARIEKEVVLRVAVVEQNLHVQQARMHTYRTLGFIVLAGGAIGGLIWLQRHRPFNPAQPRDRRLQMPEWRDHYGVPDTRILDMPSPASPSARIENTAMPQRHRASRHSNSNRNNHHPDETPSHP